MYNEGKYRRDLKIMTKNAPKKQFESGHKSKQVKVRGLPHKSHRTAEPTVWRFAKKITQSLFRGLTERSKNGRKQKEICLLDAAFYGR